MFDFNSVEIGYSVVVGIISGVSSKTNKPYTFYNVITRQATRDGSLCFKGEQVFVDGNANAFPVEMFKAYMFLYSGNGNYKNLVQVVKQADKKDK